MENKNIIYYTDELNDEFSDKVIFTILYGIFVHILCKMYLVCL